MTNGYRPDSFDVPNGCCGCLALVFVVVLAAGIAIGLGIGP